VHGAGESMSNPGANRSGVGRHQRGVGLIEVMIAVVILGIGMLGVAAMQATALRNTQSSLQRSQAVIQSYAILDAMRSNRTQADGGQYALARTCTATATGATLAINDLSTWTNSLQESLGEGSCGTIAADASMAGVWIVTVEWDDSLAGSGDVGSGSAAQTVVMRASL